MILVDANLLIYAVRVCPQQQKAAAWLNDQLTNGSRVGLPWQSLTAFLRIVTNPRIYGVHVASVDAAWSVVEEWLSCPTVWVPVPTQRHAEVLNRVLASAGRGGNLIPDAHLAALAIEHGLTLCTTDSGLARFAGLKWSNPIA